MQRCHADATCWLHMHSQPSPARACLLTAPAAAARTQTLVLAGFYIEEIAGVRQLLDEIGAAEVGGGSGWRMDTVRVCCSPW